MKSYTLLGKALLCEIPYAIYSVLYKRREKEKK